MSILFLLFFIELDFLFDDWMRLFKPTLYPLPLGVGMNLDDSGFTSVCMCVCVNLCLYVCVRGDACVCVGVRVGVDL